MAHYGNFPAFTHVRTIFVQSTKGGAITGKDLMDQLHAAELDKLVERFTYRGKPGLFSLTAKDAEKRVILENTWEDKVKEGKLHFTIHPQENPAQEQQKLTLEGLPEEVKTNTIRAYMAKYVIDPKITLITEQGEGWGPIETGKAEVVHKGLKRTLPRYVWVGPGVSALVTKTSQIPWDNHKLRCTRCRTDGHVAWECPNPPQCLKCKKDGHIAVNCLQCEICKKWGHESAKCYFREKESERNEQQEKPRGAEKEVKNRVQNIMTKKNVEKAEKQKTNTIPTVQTQIITREKEKENKNEHELMDSETTVLEDDELEEDAKKKTVKRPRDSSLSPEESGSDTTQLKKGKGDSVSSKV